MPTYKNNTDKRITFSDKANLEWFPGQERALPYFVPYDVLGLTRTSEEPYVLKGKPWRGFGYTELAISERTVYEIPYNESYELSIYCDSGYCKMYMADCDEPIMIDEKNNHFGRYAWDMASYLVFEPIDVTAVVYVKAEPFTMRGTERR